MPKGWRKESARHSLAARGLKTRIPHKSASKMSGYGLKKSGDMWGKGNKPIIVFDTSPDFDDVYNLEEQFDHLKDQYEDETKEFAESQGKSIDSITTKKDKEQFVRDFYMEHIEWFSDDVRVHWDDEKSYLKSMLNDVGFDRGNVEVVASPSGWHGETGKLLFNWNGDIDQLIEKSFGSLANDFHAKINRIGKDTIEATVSCHDIPTGAGIVIRRVEENEE